MVTMIFMGHRKGIKAGKIVAFTAVGTFVSECKGDSFNLDKALKKTGRASGRCSYFALGQCAFGCIAGSGYLLIYPIIFWQKIRRYEIFSEKLYIYLLHFFIVIFMLK